MLPPRRWRQQKTALLGGFFLSLHYSLLFAPKPLPNSMCALINNKDKANKRKD
ncbi:protein of unknown function [Candidatus Promineifilum breve]|uniref:Uncharacterized protein n=1 Tax=Candidatus Promineifilum breve TaxID=1806508 RepID=A0A160T0Y6_9CHLR|nr:protein of unknown function [Candidatus Promineifilum breve]